MYGATQYFSFNAEKVVGSTQLRNFCWSPLQPLGHSGQLRAVLESEGSVSADCSTAPSEGVGTDKDSWHHQTQLLQVKGCCWISLG